MRLRRLYAGVGGFLSAATAAQNCHINATPPNSAIGSRAAARSDQPPEKYGTNQHGNDGLGAIGMMSLQSTAGGAVLRRSHLKLINSRDSIAEGSGAFEYVFPAIGQPA
jgi:hypothetical protein